MYKATLNNTISRTNTIEGAVWEVEKLMLYPNGYININQDGNYTKHYYADDQRIASKIGGGFSNSISDGIVQNNSVFASMEEELGKVFILNDTMSNIYYPFDTITKLNGLDPEGIEDELYFYHGDHLSSTQMITDITGSIMQQILYAPFGEILAEYNAYWHQGKVPDYKFNAKEYDEENGMYYYSARYYNPPTFISRDPLFEKYFWCSPYAMTLNNPVKYVDPDGRDVWEINDQGEVVNRIKDKTQDAFHIVTKDENGVYQRVEGKSISFDYGTIQAERNPTITMQDRDGNISQTRLTLFEVKGDDNATQLFEFMGQTGVTTNVEWSHIKIGNKNSGRNIVGTTNGKDYSAVNDYVLQSKYTIREDNHSHVYSNTPSIGDMNHAQKLNAKFPNATLYNYFPPNGYTQYNSNGIIFPASKPK
jgi:RHS repeat-associated protein